MICTTNMVNVYILVTAIILPSTTISTTAVPQLTIPQGDLIGQYLYSSKDIQFSSFTGIPYAQPPVGSLRFKHPQPAEPWIGTLNATISPPICPQATIILPNRAYSGQEDCLYLNVYTPETAFPSNKKLPVMIFIYGGAFMFGSGIHDQYGPELLLNKNVVLVTMNYRLGPLGFLSTGDDVVSGNNGLRDQNMAIKWTKRNIAYFGGNPDRITLFGQAAGGSCVEYHMISPLSKDLIKGVISESGVTTAPFGLSANGENQINSRKLAAMFNCPTGNSGEMVNCLRTVDAEALTTAQYSFSKFLDYPLAPFKPVVEYNIKGALLPKSPIELIKSGHFAHVPYIVGVTTQDGAIFTPQLYLTPGALQELNDNPNEVLPYFLDYHRTGVNKKYITRQIKKFYFGNSPISNFTRPQVDKMLTDRYFFTPANNMVELLHKYSRQPVYYYAFGHNGSVSLCEVIDPTYSPKGACHYEESIFLLTSKDFFPTYVSTPEDAQMSDILTTIWTHFATTGEPTPQHDPSIITQWKPVRSPNLEYYYIKSPTSLKMEERLFWDRAKFWKTLPIYPRY